jgi:DNA-binding NarL/FixJ family response regulator
MTQARQRQRDDIIRVAIIEDDKDVRSSLALLLRSAEGFEVTGDHADCESGIPAVLETRPDVVLMDIGLPGKSGIDGILELRDKFEVCDVIILTIHEKDDVVFDALRAGATGYMVKSDGLERILASIREAYLGGAPMSTQIARMVVHSFESKPASTSPLTPRETEVLSELCKGKSYRMIGDSLFISEETVRRHLKSIYRKLEVHSKSQAVAKAFQDRLLDP